MRIPVILVPLALAACAPSPDADPVPVAPPVAVFTATEFAFAGPDTLAAGPTTFRMESPGVELHHITLVRFDEGHTLPEFLAAMAGGPPPAWAHFMGGPNPHNPGQPSETTAVLTPGEWAMLCLIPGTDGVPHVVKGMVKAFTVVPTSAPAAEPAAQIVMTLRDYDFDLSAPLTTGTHTIQVENIAGQPHEILLVRLAEGKTMHDMMEFFEKMERGAVDGPPPGDGLGGVAPMRQGERNWFSATLAPGEYAMFCFVPDVADGRPHLLHGMMRQFTVQ